MASESDAKRRVSDHHAVASRRTTPNHVDHERRRTVGASPANFTPSKHQVNLGSAAAQAYFFGGTPHSTKKLKAPHSTTAKLKTPAKSPRPVVNAELDEIADMDVSMLSAETSSSEGSDMLNKSVLSDTTELTASNFVLQASSRQLLLELSRGGEAENAAPGNQENGVTENVDKAEKPSPLGDHRKSIKPLGNTNGQDEGSKGVGTAPALNERSTPARPSPSLRSRLSASPSSLQKLTSSLRKAKQQSEEERALKTRRLSQGSALRSTMEGVHDEATHRSAARKGASEGVSFMLPPLSPAPAKHDEDTTVEIETDKPLDVLLKNLKEPAANQQGSTLPACASPSSTISSAHGQFRLPGTPNDSSKSSLRQATPHPKKDKTDVGVNGETSFASPTSTNADDESHFRLISGSQKKLTPTKISQSPRRVINPYSVDSPARNTRSAKKKDAAISPAKAPANTNMDIDSKPIADESSGTSAGDKRSRDSKEEEEIGTAALSFHNPGRLSEITMSPSLTKLKRRRSSISSPALDEVESVHSTSTASTADLNNLLIGLMGPEKKTVGGMHAGIRSLYTSPTTAEISVPRSILASSRRNVPGSQQSRKSVVFGSPDAAEYRIGSPSVSLTPMPRNTAKAMFIMPAPPGSQSSSSTDSQGIGEDSLIEDKTIEMETDMGSLVQNVTTAESAVNVDTALPAAEASSGEDMNMSEVANDPSPLSSKSILPPLGQPDEDDTVELETNIEGLFANAFGSPNNASMLRSAEKNDTTDMETSPAESIDMFDAQSVASIASLRRDKNEGGSSLEGSPQKLNFEGKLSESSEVNDKTVATFDKGHDDQSLATAAQEDEEDNTIELEADLTSLLASAGGEAAMTRETPRPITLTKKFPKMESSLVPHTKRMSFGDLLLQGNGTSKVDEGDDTFTEGSLTKELETNIESFIRATDGDNTPSASRRRSSHRFSLTPISRLSLTREGSVVSKDSGALEPDTQDEGETDNVMTTENEAISHENHEQEEVMLVLDSKELMESAGLPESPSALNISDTLTNANTNSENFRNPLIAEAMASFVFAVCGEVEMKAESSSDGNSCFNTLVEDSVDQLLELQKALRSSDGFKAAKGKEEMKRLARAAQTFVEFEWKSWEVQVISSLAQALDGIVGDFEESDERLMSHTTLADDALEAVSLMEGRAVQKARRRSMSRRRVRVSYQSLHEVQVTSTTDFLSSLSHFAIRRVRRR